MTDTSTLIVQLRALVELTNTEIQIAHTRQSQARTEAVATELAENADNARGRADSIERALRGLGGRPSLVGPLLGRAAAAFKTVTEQVQPFDEALLGDLALEHQLLDRSRYLKALATAGQQRDIVQLADELITAHTATAGWLTTVLAEDALGGPAALRRTPVQAAAGAAVRWMNTPASWSTNSIGRAMDAARFTGPRISQLLSRGAHAGESEPDQLPIADYETLNGSAAVTAVKELTEPADIRTIVAYEESNKNRHRVVSAAQTRLATIAQEITGIG